MWKTIGNKRQRIHTIKGCSKEKTITSATEGVNPFPMRTDFWANAPFITLMVPKHPSESTGQLSAKDIHQDTYKQKSKFEIMDKI